MHNPARVSVDTPYGPVVGGRAANDAVIFLCYLAFSLSIVKPTVGYVLRLICVTLSTV